MTGVWVANDDGTEIVRARDISVASSACEVLAAAPRIPEPGSRRQAVAAARVRARGPKIATAGESAMAQGTVKWFNTDKGYGFIAPDDGTPDVFVHHSAIKAGGYRGLQDNQRVEFTVSQGAKGPQADEVRAI
jgi:CspA family cold shock protein